MLLSNQRADEVPTQIDLKKEGMTLKIDDKNKVDSKEVVLFFAKN